MEEGRIKTIADSLSDEQRIIMFQLERTRKTNSRYFSEEDLGRKKKIWERSIKVHDVLVELEALGLTSRVNSAKGLWEATATGFLVEHYISKQELERQNPGLSKIIRR